MSKFQVNTFYTHRVTTISLRMCQSCPQQYLSASHQKWSYDPDSHLPKTTPKRFNSGRSRAENTARLQK